MNQALYIQPMTARDSAYAEGRKAGLQEAAEHVHALGRDVPQNHASRGIVRHALVSAAAELRSLAGEP